MKTFTEVAKDEEDKIYSMGKYKADEYTGFDKVYKHLEVDQKMSSDDETISKKKRKRKSIKRIGLSILYNDQLLYLTYVL